MKKQIYEWRDLAAGSPAVLPIVKKKSWITAQAADCQTQCITTCVLSRVRGQKIMFHFSIFTPNCSQMPFKVVSWHVIPNNSSPNTTIRKISFLKFLQAC